MHFTLCCLNIWKPSFNKYHNLSIIDLVVLISTSDTTFLLLLTGYFDVLKTKSIMDKLWYLLKLGIQIFKQHKVINAFNIKTTNNNFALVLIIVFTGKQSYNKINLHQNFTIYGIQMYLNVLQIIEWLKFIFICLVNKHFGITNTYIL
jgi:hypothetical protein